MDIDVLISVHIVRANERSTCASVHSGEHVRTETSAVCLRCMHSHNTRMAARVCDWLGLVKRSVFCNYGTELWIFYWNVFWIQLFFPDCHIQLGKKCWEPTLGLICLMRIGHFSFRSIFVLYLSQ